MECRLDTITVHYEVYGTGKPIVMLHGFSLDHRMMVGCMEPIFSQRPGWQRIYVDLPGMGRTKGEDWINGSDEMLQVVVEFIDTIIPNQRFLIAGESYGGYLARGVARKKADIVDGIALICPMIVPDKTNRDLPDLMVIKKDEAFLAELKKEQAEEFTSLAVVQDRYNWERFEREIVAGASLADNAFLDKIKRQYGFSFDVDAWPAPFPKPALFLLGRQDASVGYRDAWRILENYPRATFAVLDRAGHNLQIEQKGLFDALVSEWLDRVEENGE
jgi:pimeloyl-ACP methyl ester carboxylesterase